MSEDELFQDMLRKLQANAGKRVAEGSLTVNGNPETEAPALLHRALDHLWSSGVKQVEFLSDAEDNGASPGDLPDEVILVADTPLAQLALRLSAVEGDANDAMMRLVTALRGGQA